GERVARVRERGVHPLASLLHGSLRQPHGGEGGEAVRDVGLDVHEIGVDAEHGGGADAREHGGTVRRKGRKAVGKNAPPGVKYCSLTSASSSPAPQTSAARAA